MFLSKLSIQRPILVSMILLAVVLFGLLAFFGIPLNLMPSIKIPYVTIQVVYPGAGPVEVETEITKKIEDEVATISGIKTMTSYAMENVGITVVEFELGKDVDIANQEVKDKVDSIVSSLPADAEAPVITKLDINAMPIIDILLSGNLDMRELYDIADKRVKDRLSQIKGVAKVEVTGGQQREIRVELDNRMVFQNSISLAQLGQILAAQNIDMPAGQFQQRSQEYAVRMKGQLDSVEALRQLEIPTQYGTKKLGQIANVSDTSADVRERTVYFNNKTKSRDENVILLSIIPAPDGNTVEIADGVQKALPLLGRELPSGSSLTVVNDDSLFIKSTVNDTLMNVFLGIILTAGVLLFFLHDLRSTLIAALAMPVSIISTFVLLQMAGFSKNIMTLMGLSVSVGILVTNSVVVLENIFRHIGTGQSRIEASDRGTSEIATAVLASTLTNVAVFLPIGMVHGMVGLFLKEFALTVVFATLFSLIVSFTLTPMLASRILPEHDRKKHPVGQRLEKMFRSWESGYHSMLERLLSKRSRGVALIAVVLVFFAGSLMLAGRIGFEFFPNMDRGNINIEAELPQGYNLAQTADLMAQIEGTIQHHPEIVHMVTKIGALSELDQGTNMAQMNIMMVDAKQRTMSDKQMENILVRELSTVPNVKIRVQAAGMGGPGGYPIEFYLQGQDNDTLESYRSRILAELRDVPGLVNLTTSSRPGKPEVTLVPDRVKVEQAGLNVYDLAMALRGAVEGIVATTYREGGEEYDIRVTMSDASVDTPEEVGNITVASPAGVFRLNQVSDVRFTEGYSKMMHRDKYKVIQFGASPAPGYALGDVVGSIQQKIRGIELPPGYRISWGGEAEQMQEMTMDMARAFLIAILITYMLLAAILENLFQPLLILGTVPLALIGVFAALYLTGQTMNLSSMMAIIMLVGIVVNNAILLLDYTNILKRQGRSTKEALLEACPVKLKPIIMSTSAIVLGMMPLAIGLGASGAEIRQPMGIVSIGGLLVSTLLTLFVIPTAYNLFTRDRRSRSANL
jgi:HAE1 family hydrophobic/amphiphilic exporter-1